jgi:hypothetical protein
MARRLAGWIALTALGALLAGCAATQSATRTVTGWFGADEAASPQRPQARYSAVEGVALHEQPDDSSPTLGKLGRHEGVLRYQRENGFAYVTSETSGRSGWVREGELIERLPATRKPAASAPSVAPEPAVAPDDPAGADEPAEALEPTEPGEPPAEAPEKSIFDPY